MSRRVASASAWNMRSVLSASVARASRTTIRLYVTGRAGGTPVAIAMSSGRWQRHRRMRIVISEFMSLDGVVQAPGGAEEDTDGGFQHGGWSMPFFDVEVMGPAIDEVAQRTDALLYGRRTWQ